jgi:hypothetical protein
VCVLYASNAWPGTADRTGRRPRIRLACTGRAYKCIVCEEIGVAVGRVAGRDAHVVGNVVVHRRGQQQQRRPRIKDGLCLLRTVGVAHVSTAATQQHPALLLLFLKKGRSPSVVPRDSAFFPFPCFWTKQGIVSEMDPVNRLQLPRHIADVAGDWQILRDAPATISLCRHTTRCWPPPCSSPAARRGCRPDPRPQRTPAQTGRPTGRS